MPRSAVIQIAMAMIVLGLSQYQLHAQSKLTALHDTSVAGMNTVLLSMESSVHHVGKRLVASRESLTESKPLDIAVMPAKMGRAAEAAETESITRWNVISLPSGAHAAMKTVKKKHLARRPFQQVHW